MCWWTSGKTSGPRKLLILWGKDHVGIVEEVGGTVTTVHPGNWVAVNVDAFSELFEGWNNGVIKTDISCVEAEK